MGLDIEGHQAKGRNESDHWGLVVLSGVMFPFLWDVFLGPFIACCLSLFHRMAVVLLGLTNHQDSTDVILNWASS